MILSFMIIKYHFAKGDSYLLISPLEMSIIFLSLQSLLF